VPVEKRMGAFRRTSRQAKVQVAREASVRELVLFHHDPALRDETELEALTKEGRRIALRGVDISIA